MHVFSRLQLSIEEKFYQTILFRETVCSEEEEKKNVVPKASGSSGSDEPLRRGDLLDP